MMIVPHPDITSIFIRLRDVTLMCCKYNTVLSILKMHRVYGTNEYTTILETETL